MSDPKVPGQGPSEEEVTVNETNDSIEAGQIFKPNEGAPHFKNPAFEKAIDSSTLLAFERLGIDPRTLSQEEINLLNQAKQETIEMYRPESIMENNLSDDRRWELIRSGKSLSTQDYEDHIVNSWLVRACGVTIDELGAIQGFQAARKGEGILGIVLQGWRDKNIPLELFDTPEKRSQLTSAPAIIEFRRKREEEKNRLRESMGIAPDREPSGTIVDEEDTRDDKTKEKDIRDKMRGKSEQEIRQVLNREFDRTGD